LYRAEALANELIQLVAAFRPICRLGSRQTTTKKKESQLKLQELAQSLDDSSKTLAILTNTIQGEKKRVVSSSVQQSQSAPMPVSAEPVARQSQSASMLGPLPLAPTSPVVHVPVSSDSLMRLSEIIFNKYDADEFKVLCIRMGTDFDSLRAGKLELKMFYLVDYCYRHNRYEMLIQQMLKDFPDLQGQL
jgi:hypothetical protein